MKTLTLSLLLALAPLAAHAQLVDESTGKKFDVETKVGDTTYKCIGAGVRKVFIVKAYALTFCLDAAKADQIVADAKKGHSGKSGDDLADALEDDQKFYDALSTSDADKLVIMKVVRDIGREKIANAFSDALSGVLPPAKVKQLVDVVPGDIKDGQSALIYSQGDTLVIDIAGNAKRLQDAEIVSKLWRVWLGKDSVSNSLKESIAKRAAK